MSDYGYCPTCGSPGVMRRGGSVKCLANHWHPETAFTRRAPRGIVREQLIEGYFEQHVKETGGTVRKVTWPGHDGAPDRLAGWPGRHGLVELKRPGGSAEAHQLREHARLREIGFRVDVLDSREAIDAYVQEMTG